MALLPALLLLHGCRERLGSEGLIRIGEIHSFSNADAQSGRRVVVAGVVTYHEGFLDAFTMQDATGAIHVELLPGQRPIAAGDRVEIAGALSATGDTPEIVLAQIRSVSPGPEPPAVPLLPAPRRARSGAELAKVPENARATVWGTITNVENENAAVRVLSMRTGSRRVRVRIPQYQLEIAGLVDAEVVVTGVLTSSGDISGAALEFTLAVNTAADLRVARPAPDVLHLPVQTIGALVRLGTASIPPHRVRISGVASTVQGIAKVRDSSGEIESESSLGNGQVDVAAFVNSHDGGLVLTGVVPAGEELKAASGKLTTALAVHSLSAKEAARSRPVELHAVATYCSEFCFVQDGTDGIFVQLESLANVVPAGTAVVVTGQSIAGDFAPSIGHAHLQATGKVSLPAPEKNAERAFLGSDDSRWIEIEGVVENAGPRSIWLAFGQHRVQANFPAADPRLMDLIDARVAVRGVCGSLFNYRRQLLGIQMFVPDIRFVSVKTKGQKSVGGLPVRSATSLLNYSPDGEFVHHVRLLGTVTLSSGGDSVWIRDASGGIQVKGQGLAKLVPGDIVDAVGFPVTHGLSAVLDRAVVQRVGHHQPPAPVNVSSVEAAGGKYDGELVAVRAKLLNRVVGGGEQIWVMQSGKSIFNARLNAGDQAGSFEVGSILRLTGICSTRTDRSRSLIVGQGFDLIVQSAANVQVITPAPWWNPERLQLLAMGALLLIAIAMGWGFLLRSKVAAQAHTLIRRTVQLEEARLTAESALLRAQTAELLEQQKKRILELIARDEPLEIIAGEMATAINTHGLGRCTIQIAGPAGRIAAAPGMDNDWRGALQQLNLAGLRTNCGVRPVVELSSEPSWLEFASGTSSLGGPERVYAAPILAGTQRAGVLAIFVEKEREVAGSEIELARSWASMAAMAYERRSLYDQLSFRVTHDELTGLPNRLYLFEQLDVEIGCARQNQTKIGLIYIDLDGFKKANDTFGHAVGDGVLVEAAKRMRDVVRTGDTVSRLGGDEFVVLLPGVPDRESAEHIGRKIVAAMAGAMVVDGKEVRVGASLGMSVYPEDGEDPGELLRLADHLMYRDKMGKPELVGA